MKQASDQAGTVRALVLLTSDKVLANPLTDLNTPAAWDQVYRALGIGSEYFVSQVLLMQITLSNAGLYAYNFAPSIGKLSSR